MANGRVLLLFAGVLGVLGAGALSAPVLAQHSDFQGIALTQSAEPPLAGALVVPAGVLPDDEAEDAAVTANVKSAIAASVGANAAKINVETRVAIVTLSGQVPSTAIRDRAREAAWIVSGVVDVIDRIQVASTG